MPRLRPWGANAACTEIIQHEKVGLISGSYLETYCKGTTGYGEVKGYSPVPMGAVYATVIPDKHIIKASI